MLSPQLIFDYLRCERIIRHHSKSFFRAFSTLTDSARRRGVYAVYAFCRYVDDLIDVAGDIKALMLYKNALDAFVKGNIPNHFRWRALADTAKRFYPADFNYQPYYMMFEGQEFDAMPVRMTTLDQLLYYCDLVAGSVGLMLLPILAPQATINLSQFAITLGRAFQLTNILRDIKEDFLRDRIYIPSSLMAQFHYTRDDLANNLNQAQFQAMWKHLASIAENYYQEALTYVAMFPLDTQKPLYASIVIYRHILTVIARNNYDVFTRKHFVTDEEKLSLLKSFTPKK
jgi:phytoene synthase